MRPRMSKIWDGLKMRGRFAKASAKDLVGPGLWLTALLVLFALPCLFSSPGATRVQWQGMFFQCAGVLLVAWGLADTRHRLFHKTPLRRELWDRVRRVSYVIKPPPPINISAEMAGAGNAIIGAGEVRINVPAVTLEERLTALTKDVRRVEETVSALQRDLLNAKREVGERIDRESSERQIENRSIRDLLEKATVGGIHLEFAGVGFLLAGILFTSVPEWVASVLQKIGA
jgi:hypothetical protein